MDSAGVPKSDLPASFAVAVCLSTRRVARQTPTVRQLAFCEDDLAVNLNRTQILGALILAAIALVALLVRWKLAP
jgi:hypothetical protein